MDFGRIDASQLYLVHFKLDRDNTNSVLPGKPFNTKFYIGLGQRGKLTWPQYTRTLNALEFSGSFYAFPSKKSIDGHTAHVTEDFVFVPKMLQTVTHYKRFINTQQDVEKLMASLGEFGHRLGPILVLIHPQLTPKDIERIREFVVSLNRHPFAIEMRNAVWFQDGYDKDIMHLLQDFNGMTVITDTPGKRDVVHMHLSGARAYIRFVSCHDPIRDQKRLTEWVERLKEWRSKGLEECYFMVHSDDDVYTLAMAEGVVSALGIATKPTTGELF